MLRIRLRGDGRAQPQCRLPVVRQQDRVSCGLFVLFYCCFIVRNLTTWRQTIGVATFRLEDMRAWLALLRVDGAHVAFTLEQLPAFIPAEASQGSGMVLEAGHADTTCGVSFIRVTTTLPHWNCRAVSTLAAHHRLRDRP